MTINTKRCLKALVYGFVTKVKVRYLKEFK